MSDEFKSADWARDALAKRQAVKLVPVMFSDTETLGQAWSRNIARLLAEYSGAPLDVLEPRTED